MEASRGTELRRIRLADAPDAIEFDTADVLGRLTRRYDRLFQVTFPYSMGLHQRHSWRNTRRTGTPASWKYADNARRVLALVGRNSSA